MTAPIYNTIGHHYRAHRAADRRIVNKIIALMAVPQGSFVCDVGAGAVICVLANHHFTSLRETAAEMQRICPAGPLVWFRAGDAMNTLSAAGSAFSFGIV